jgi:6-phosphogluconolactonase (cycloisomerase 2 family)
MKRGNRARLLWIAAPVLIALTACGHFWQAPSGGGGGGCTTNCTTLSSGVFYVLNQGTNEVAALKITSGALTTVGTYTLPTVGPLAMALAPNGNFLYVSTEGGGIYVYTVGSGGVLTIGNGGAALSADPATTMQVDATNAWLVEGISGVAQLNAIALNSTTGLLAASSEKEQVISLPAATVSQLAISPNDSTSCTDCYVFVAMGAGGTEEVHFSPGNANPFGGVGTTKVLNSGGAAKTVAVDPSNLLLYIGETDALPSEAASGGLRVFVIGASSITENSGSPYSSGGTGPTAILPQTGYVYVANTAGATASGNIASFTLTTGGTSTAPTYTFASLGTLSTGDYPVGMVIDSTSDFLLAVSEGGNPDLEAYTMSSGDLTTVLSVATGTDPVQAIAIAAAP